MRLGVVGGIELRVHASMLVLVWLVVATEEAADAPGTLVWLVAVFACVLLHELAHSLVARRVGVQVREIELLPIGGISKMDRIPDEPSHEIAIAAAGPLTSVVIGVVLLLPLAATTSVWPPDLYGGALLPRIGWFNLFIAAFNLIPALPLDGGRLLRALLERQIGPFAATRRAARMGRWLAYALIALGAALNIFLMIIGVFVYITSRAEEVASVVHHELEGVAIAEVMIHGPVTLSSDTTVHELEHVMTTTAQRQFPIVDADGRYVGLLDAAGITAAASATPVGDLMDTRGAVQAGDLVESTGLLEGSTPAVAVVEGGRVVGLVRAEDVAHLVERGLRQAPPPEDHI